jgi:hypothetical protein
MSISTARANLWPLAVSSKKVLFRELLQAGGAASASLLSKSNNAEPI